MSLMNVVQIVSEGASRFARKAADFDRTPFTTRLVAAADGARDEAGDPVDVAAIGRDRATVVHVYGAESLPVRVAARIAAPWSSDGSVPQSRLPWRRARPATVTSPFPIGTGSTPVAEIPEAVSPDYASVESRRRAGGTPRLVGTIRATDDAWHVIEGIRIRIARFREDIDWLVFDDYPDPDQMTELDAWVDAAISPNDLDGGTAEALCAGIPVVASRTPVNEHRLQGGDAGLLVAPGDANEFTHVLLGALFKPETVEGRVDVARRIRLQFDPVRRAEALEALQRDLLAADSR